MKRTIERGIEALKNMVTFRCATLPQPALAALLDEIDRFGVLLGDECARLEQRHAAALAENALLRDLAGAPESTVIERMLRQNAECDALRRDAGALRDAVAVANAAADDLRERLAVAENDHRAAERRHQEQVDRFQAALDGLTARIHAHGAARPPKE